MRQAALGMHHEDTHRSAMDVYSRRRQVPVELLPLPLTPTLPLPIPLTPDPNPNPKPHTRPQRPSLSRWRLMGFRLLGIP